MALCVAWSIMGIKCDGAKVPVSECALKVSNLGGTKHLVFYFIYYSLCHLVIKRMYPPHTTAISSFLFRAAL